MIDLFDLINNEDGMLHCETNEHIKEAYMTEFHIDSTVEENTIGLNEIENSDTNFNLDSSDNTERDVGSIIIGDPIDDMKYWEEQQFDDSCAISAQKEIIESITGERVSESDLTQFAYENGWYEPGKGTNPECVGNLIEAYGIPVEKSYDLSITDIANALEKGEKVIVGLDANEIWNPIKDESGNPIEQPEAGHAVWVTGIKQNNNGEISVILNDTGTSNGRCEEVKIEDFINAWQDYGNFATITNTKGEIELNGKAEKNDVSFGGYYNRDETYHWTSDGANTDKNGKIVSYS